MTEMQDIPLDEHDRLAADMEKMLGALVTGFSSHSGYSSLSSTTLALQVLVEGLQQIGGPAAKSYALCVVEASFAPDNLPQAEATKLNRRAKQAMERMAAHFDQKVAEFRKRSIQ